VWCCCCEERREAEREARCERDWEEAEEKEERREVTD
jgi:hypothetical protein